MLVVAVVGSKKSGKTTAVETLVRGLTRRGYKVATVKHIPEAGFTIDTQEKTHGGTPRPEPALL